MARARPRDRARGSAQAARRRRPARRAPVRRDRLEHRRLADGAAPAGAGADVLGRLRRRPLRRAGSARGSSRSATARCTRRCCSSRTRPRCCPGSPRPTTSRSATPPPCRRTSSPKSPGVRSPSRWSATAATRRSEATSATRRTGSRRGSTARCRPASCAPVRARCAPCRPAAASFARRSCAPPASSTSPAPTPAERYGRLMEIFPASLRRSLWTDEALAQIGSPPSAGTLLGAPPAPGISGLQLLDLATYLPGDLLYKADIASMACSLELRAPFLDHEVIELGLALPDSLKVRGTRGKVALRRAFAADLPPEILGRGKRGFGVPVARWFRTDLRELAGDLLLGESASARGLFHRGAVETPARRPRRRAGRPRRTGSGASSCSSCGSASTPTRRPSRLRSPPLGDPPRPPPHRRRRLRRAAALRAPLRARQGAQRVHGEERRLRAHLRRQRHLRLHPGRAVGLDAAAVRLLPDPDLRGLRARLARRRSRADRDRARDRAARLRDRPAGDLACRRPRRSGRLHACIRTSSGTTCTSIARSSTRSSRRRSCC